MGRMFFEFKDADTAWDAREAVNNISSRLPATHTHGTRSFELQLDELRDDDSETRAKIMAIIQMYGGESC